MTGLVLRDKKEARLDAGGSARQVAGMARCKGDKQAGAG